MIQLFPLRPVQIIDVSFQLLRKKFLYSFLIALLVSTPLQAAIWIVQVSINSDAAGDDLTGRTLLIVAIIQFSAIGISLTLVSNLLSQSVGKIYSSTIFSNVFTIHKTPARFAVAFYHVSLQLLFVIIMLAIRFGFGRILSDDDANTYTFIILCALGAVWIVLTLWLGFSVPICVHEGGSFSQILKRSSQINRVHFFKLIGVYSISVCMILILTFPSISLVQIFLANDLIKSDLGNWALFNMIMSVTIAGISATYSYILTVTYFNARIEHEGFDISVAIENLEREGSMNGKPLNSVA